MRNRQLVLEDLLYVLDDTSPKVERDPLVWLQEFMTTDWVVRQDKIGDVDISTVFLGVDYQFGSGPPLLFETMTSIGEEVDTQRYSTWDEAVKGHEATVASYKNRL